jgi:hypothetical protein
VPGILLPLSRPSALSHHGPFLIKIRVWRLQRLKSVGRRLCQPSCPRGNGGIGRPEIALGRVPLT